MFDFENINLESIEKYLPNFYTSEFTLTELNINAYQYLQWKKADLLLKSTEVDDTKKWVRITYTEAAWIKLIQKMKEFELSSEAIRVLRDELKLKVPSINEPHYLDLIEKSNLLTQFDSELTAKELFEMMMKLKSNKDPFDTKFNFLIIGQIVTETETQVLLYREADRWKTVITNKEILEKVNGTDEVYEKVKKEAHFVFPLKDCIDDLNLSFLQNEKPKYLDKNPTLNEKEKMLIKEIQKREFKEILIKNKNNEELKIEIKEDRQINTSDLKQIASVLGHKNYKKISITKRNDEHAYLEITRDDQTDSAQ